eukprot:8914504-Pyramimonas_sp.AAC.1
MRGGKVTLRAGGFTMRGGKVTLQAGGFAPAVAPGLLDEVLEGTATGGGEERQPRDAVVVGGLAGAVHLRQEGGGGPVAGVLRVVPVEAAEGATWMGLREGTWGLPLGH